LFIGGLPPPLTGVGGMAELVYGLKVRQSINEMSGHHSPIRAGENGRGRNYKL
jgi:hypothetical protein